MKPGHRSTLLAVSALTALAGAAPAGAAPTAALPDPVAHPQAFRTPPNDVRPKTRWWWGSGFAVSPLALDPAETRREVRALADAGFGGAEIAFSPKVWANDTQRENLQAALEQAKDSGLHLDMTMGAKWPTTTPETTKGTEHSSKELQYGRVSVAGGAPYSGVAPRPYDDASNARNGRLVAVTAARVLTPGPAVGTVNVPPSSSTLLDPASLVDLTARVRDDGTLDWTAPAGGDWVLFGFWQRDANQGVVDHFDRDAIAAAQSYVERNQLGAGNSALASGLGAGFFEDSIELKAEGLLWSPTLAAQFERRRGYAMAKYLPLMFQQGMNTFPVPETPPVADFDLPGTAGDRVRHDFYETLTDLYVDDHLETMADWAADKGGRYRTQAAFGQDLDTVRSARGVTAAGGLADSESYDAGDTFPYDLTNVRRWRFGLDLHRSIASGSFQGGSTEIHSELGAASPRGFNVNQADLKGIMDKEWAGGSSTPMLHGYSYQSATAKWPGDLIFGDYVADSWNDRTFPQWAMWKPLTDYWARGTYVLRSGTPKTDVAVYRDAFTTIATPEPTATRKALFDGLQTELRGYSLGYVDPDGVVDGARGATGRLFARGPAYKALVIDERALPADAAEAIADQAEQGLAVVLVGEPPTRDTGYADRAASDRRVRDAVERILAAPTTARVAAQADAGAALERLAVRPDAQWKTPAQVYSQHRRTATSDLYYLYNATNDVVDLDASFAGTGRPYRMDLWTGDVTPLGAFAQADGRTDTTVRVEPLGTTVIAIRRDEQAPARHVLSAPVREVVERDADTAEVRDTTGGERSVRVAGGGARTVALPSLPQPLTVSSWALHVEEETPDGDVPHDLRLDALQDWRGLPGLQGASGTGTYTADVTLPDGWTAGDRGTYLRLGAVAGSIRVTVNGRSAGADSVAGRDLDVSSLLHAGSNEVRVVLATSLRNGVTKAQGGSVTAPYGLLGPVQLVPFGRATVDLRTAAAPGTPAPSPAPPTAPTPGPATPAAGVLRIGAPMAVRAATLRRRGVLVRVSTPVPGRIALSLRRGSTAVGSARRTVRRPGAYRVRLTLSTAGRRRLATLRRGRTATLTVRAQVRIDGRTRTVRRTLKVRG